MIRDRLKNVIKKAAVKAFNMEFDVEDRQPAAPSRVNPADFDPSVIPKLVDGSGDTPGPNHKEDIGRPWVSAQLASDAAGFILDIRPPADLIVGRIPTSVHLPGDQVKQQLNRLPAKEDRITVYDQTGMLGSDELAAWLRGQGWVLARRLQGGFAEWLSFGETIEPVPPVPGAAHKVGDPVRLKDGREGVVQAVDKTGAGIRYTVWFSGGDTAGPLADDAFSA